MKRNIPTTAIVVLNAAITLLAPAAAVAQPQSQPRPPSRSNPDAAWEATAKIVKGMILGYGFAGRSPDGSTMGIYYIVDKDGKRATKDDWQGLFVSDADIKQNIR